MSIETRQEAEPLHELLDPRTLQLVGWMYQWDNGEVEPLWRADRKTKVNLGRRINDPNSYARLNYRNFVLTYVNLPSCAEQTGVT